MQLSDLLIPILSYSLLGIVSWGMPLGVSGYAPAYLFTAETEARFKASYLGLRRPRQVAALFVTTTICGLVWARAPDWLAIPAVIAAFIAYFALLARHLFLAKRAAARS